MQLLRGFRTGDNERASQDSSDEFEDRDIIKDLLSSPEVKQDEGGIDMITQQAEAATRAADAAVKAGVRAVAAVEEASGVSAGME